MNEAGRGAAGISLREWATRQWGLRGCRPDWHLLVNGSSCPPQPPRRRHLFPSPQIFVLLSLMWIKILDWRICPSKGERHCLIIRSNAWVIFTKNTSLILHTQKNVNFLHFSLPYFRLYKTLKCHKYSRPHHGWGGHIIDEHTHTGEAIEKNSLSRELRGTHLIVASVKINDDIELIIYVPQHTILLLISKGF